MDVDESSADSEKPLAGLKIVCSGEFESVSRKKLEELIGNLGGQVMSGVSSKTHYLIVGYKLEDGRDVTQGSKYAKAKKIGMPILREKEFEDLVRTKSGNPDFTLSARKSLAAPKSGDAAPAAVIRKSLDIKEPEEQAMWTDLYSP
jgi:replication factor C subunit 1